MTVREAMKLYRMDLEPEERRWLRDSLNAELPHLLTRQEWPAEEKQHRLALALGILSGLSMLSMFVGIGAAAYGYSMTVSTAFLVPMALFFSVSIAVAIFCDVRR